MTTERGNIGEDEPVVVFRAQDELLPALLDHYASMCETAGSPQRHLDAIDDARQTIVVWQDRNHTKVPQSASYTKETG